MGGSCQRGLRVGVAEGRGSGFESSMSQCRSLQRRPAQLPMEHDCLRRRYVKQAKAKEKEDRQEAAEEAEDRGPCNESPSPRADCESQTA